MSNDKCVENAFVSQNFNANLMHISKYSILLWKICKISELAQIIIVICIYVPFQLFRTFLEHLFKRRGNKGKK